MIFLTGATGLLGRELLGRLLLAEPSSHFRLLARADDDLHAKHRVSEALSLHFSDREIQSFSDRLHCVAGDIQALRFGWAPDVYAARARETRSIVHCAATTQLNQTLPTARRSNVVGAETVLQFAREAHSLGDPLQRFDYVSTAYVAGDSQRVMHPDELDVGQGFRNAYEQSKFEAELLVRQSMDALPITIHRPSIIVGDSVTGYTSSFNVIYIPLRLIAQGLLSILPARPNAPFDVVPVDYAADTIVGVRAAAASVGSCFHISAGLGRETSVREMLDAFVHAYRQIGRGILHVPQFVTPDVIKSFNVRNLERHVAEKLGLLRRCLELIPYMINNPQFDTSTTAAIRGASHSEAPLFTEYAENIFQYCFASDWGKRTFEEALEPVPLRSRFATAGTVLG